MSSDEDGGPAPDLPACSPESVERLFHEAAELPPERRATFLAVRCGADMLLRARVEALLAHDDGDGSFLAGPGGGSRRDEAGGSIAGLPERIGRYRLIGVIGEGGMGVVYEAEQDEPRRRVALKVMRSSLLGRDTVLRFQREAAALARMRHAGIAQIYEAGTSPGPAGGLIPYVAMELVRGASLDADVRSRALRPAEILALVAEIADIVEHAHRQGVVHRDLKPANILVERGDDGSARPRILDFGIARVAASADESAAGLAAPSLRTDVGQVLGTLPYMSPEQVAGRTGSVDARTDVYALGAILYELLAGRLPHDLRGRPIAEAARIIQDEDPSRLSTVDRGFRGDIETIVATALEKDPDRRYPSAEAFAEDIRRHLAHTPIRARPASRLERAGKFVRRHRALVAAGGAVVVVSLTAAVVSTMAWFRAERERQSAERRYEVASALSELIRDDVASELERLPGGRHYRLSLLKKVTPYYEELARERPDDPARIRGAWLGLIALGRDYEAEGEVDLARSTLRQAIVAVRDATARGGGSAEGLLFQEDLGWATYHLGWTEQRGGDRTLAARLYRESIEPLAKVVAARGPTAGAGEKLALARRRLGDLINESGDGPGARTEYLAALAIDEARAAAKPEDGPAQMALTRSWRRLGQLARQDGHLDEAISWLSRAVELRQALTVDLHGGTDSWHNLSVALQDLSGAQLDAGNVAAASESLRRALEACERAMERDGTDVLNRAQLMLVESQRSVVLDRAGDAEGARAAGVRAVADARAAIALPEPTVALRAAAAQVLLEAMPAELRGPAEALGQLDAAIKASGGTDVSMWTLKASAMAQLGRPADAADAQRRAIELIAPGDAKRRAEAGETLRRYQSASSGGG